jgi:hypothetical protein
MGISNDIAVAIEKAEVERLGQIEWLADLAETIENGDTQTALDTIRAAVRMLEK